MTSNVCVSISIERENSQVYHISLLQRPKDSDYAKQADAGSNDCQSSGPQNATLWAIRY